MRPQTRLSLLAAGLATLLPLTVTSSGEIRPRYGTCETCCRETTATCVVCGTVECVRLPEKYLGKIGPCATQPEV